MKRIVRLSLAAVLVVVCAIASVSHAAMQPQEAGKGPLPSWNETPVKQQIIDFANEVSDPSGPLYVPEKERIAVFDLDGTLFCEKPLYLQVLIAAERLYELADANPELRGQQPYKGCWERDWDYISDSKNFLEMNLTAFEGMLQEEYMEYSLRFLRRDHPVFGVPYIALLYAPMMELLDFLEEKGFRIYLVSGSPQAFIRSFSEEALGIGRERVIGDTIKIAFEVRDGKVVFVREHAVVEPEVLREGKPENIRMRLGRSAILACGNSNDDVRMLESAGAGGASRPHLSILVHHDDAEREYAYDKGADKALKTAQEAGWLTVSMKNDFKEIFKTKQLSVKAGKIT
ncbi:MAG: HAD family hydrolase [Candidatus Omnitrophota bacterium]